MTPLGSFADEATDEVNKAKAEGGSGQSVNQP
jgi:hypothetical protein